MAFSRSFKGASEFLRASKRAGSLSAPSQSSALPDDHAAFDQAILAAIVKLEKPEEVAEEVGASSGVVESALGRLIDEGFIERPDDEHPYRLTATGERYMRYSRLSKY